MKPVAMLWNAVALAAVMAVAAPAWAQSPAPPAPPPGPAWEDPGFDAPGLAMDLEGGDPGEGPDFETGPGNPGGPGDDGMGRGMGRTGRGGRMGRGARGMELMRELDLTREQRDRLADLRDKQARVAIRARADLATAGLDMRRLMRAENPDRAAINRQIDRMAQLRAEMAKARIAGMLDMRSVLTPEQREKLRGHRGT